MSTTETGFTPITLDMNLDDIDDLPGFIVPPTGSYVFEVINNPAELKDINDHQAVEMQLKLIEVLEMTGQLDDDETPPKPDDVFTQAFMLDNEFGAGNLKEFLTPIGTSIGSRNIREILSQMKGMTLVVVLKREWNKKKERNFAKIKKVMVP